MHGSETMIIVSSITYYAVTLLTLIARLYTPLYPSHFQGLYLHAITDNLVHGSLAVIVWLLGYLTSCCDNSGSSVSTPTLAQHTVVILQSVACGVISCAVDVDHFVAARSLDFQVC